MFWDYTGDKAVPNLAKGLEMQDGGKAWLLHLRRGMKWSDGKPFTADDFVFWFEDVYRNKDLVPTPSAVMAINGKQGVIEKVDTYTVRFKFPEPYFMFPDVLAGSTDLAAAVGRLSRHGRLRARALLEAVPSEVRQRRELDKKVQGGEVRQLGPDVPRQERLGAQPGSARALTLEDGHADQYRRPGRWSATRTACSWTPTGNQLPYIDKVVLTLAENLEVINLRAIAGEYDYAGRATWTSASCRSSWRTSRRATTRSTSTPATTAATLIIKFNLNYDADAGDREVVQQRRLPARALARHRPRPDQRDVLARYRHARLGRAGGHQQVQPRAAVPKAVVHARREEGQRDARQDRPGQEGRARATGCAPTARAGCASRS